ncbi:hypothetical protein, partial [Sphaerisporangium melleum]
MRKGTAAISAGALALALSGGTALLVAAPAAGSSVRAIGCDRSGLALPALLGGGCDLPDASGGMAAGPSPAGGPATTEAGRRSPEVDAGVTTEAGRAGERPVTGADQPGGDGLKPLTDTLSDLGGDALKPLTDTLSDTVDRLDGELGPVTDGLKKTTDKVLGGSPSTRAQPSASTAPSAAPSRPAEPADDDSGLLDLPVDTECLPVVTLGDCDAEEASPS